MPKCLVIIYNIIIYCAVWCVSQIVRVGAVGHENRFQRTVSKRIMIQSIFCRYSFELYTTRFLHVFLGVTNEKLRKMQSSVMLSIFRYDYTFTYRGRYYISIIVFKLDNAT